MRGVQGIVGTRVHPPRTLSVQTFWPLRHVLPFPAALRMLCPLWFQGTAGLEIVHALANTGYVCAPPYRFFAESEEDAEAYGIQPFRLGAGRLHR